MRLPPSVISIIESHVASSSNPSRSRGPAVLKALTPALQPQSLANVKTPRLSVRAALRRHPRIPSIALSAAHRILTDHASEPCSSSQVTFLLRRQRIYERLIRTFTAYPFTEWVTIASVFQRMMDEGTPPNLDTLKIVLSAAMRNGMPVIPIVRKVVSVDGLPDQMDSHLLMLVTKALVREAGIKGKPLEKMVAELGKDGTFVEDGILDEVLIEAYGQEGDMRGILNTISRHRLSHGSQSAMAKRSSSLSIYLQALRQWTLNPALRRKRRGSMFPRILAKDVVNLYGTDHDLPLVWLNAWMNGERICGDVEAALTIWRMIGDSGDQISYSTYFKLSKLLPAEQASADLRSTFGSLMRKHDQLNIETLHSALSAAIHHGDLPLGLLLVRRIIRDTKGHLEADLSERAIDLIASGIIRSRRASISASASASRHTEFVTQQEWSSFSLELDIADTVLPLARPQAQLSMPGKQAGDTLIKTFSPNRIGSRPAYLRRILARLVVILEDAVVQASGRDHGHGVLGQSRERALADVMTDLQREVLAA